jgi:hypothetical protein
MRLGVPTIRAPPCTRAVAITGAAGPLVLYVYEIVHVVAPRPADSRTETLWGHSALDREAVIGVGA